MISFLVHVFMFIFIMFNISYIEISQQYNEILEKYMNQKKTFRIIFKIPKSIQYQILNDLFIITYNDL